MAAAKVVPFRGRADSGEPYAGSRAKRLLGEIMEKGQLSFSKHAREEMAKDHMQATDVVNVLRAGWVESSEQERGTWRYRVKTQRMFVVVAFRGTNSATVVTAWRVK